MSTPDFIFYQNHVYSSDISVKKEISYKITNFYFYKFRDFRQTNSKDRCNSSDNGLQRSLIFYNDFVKTLPPEAGSF